MTGSTENIRNPATVMLWSDEGYGMMICGNIRPAGTGEAENGMDARILTAQIVGFIGIAVAFISFQCKDNRRLFFYQLLSSIIWVIHFLILKAYAGVLLNAAGAVRGFFLYNSDKKWGSSKVTMTAITILMIACGIITWTGPISLFPAIGMAAGTIAMWSGNGRLLRWVQLLCVSPFWIVYNIPNQSYTGIICESMNMISVIIALIRFRKQKN